MRKTDFDTKLIIYRSRQVVLILAVLIMTAIFTYMIMKNDESGFPWFVLVFPMIALGLLFLLFPITEEWEYKPWQGNTRKIEQQER